MTSNDEPSPVLRLTGLEHEYPDGTRALSGVDLTVQPGERVALVGPNASGKTTLLLHLSGILTATRGEVEIAGVALGDKTLRHARRHIGMLFQDPDDQLFMPTLFDDVVFGPVNMGLSPSEAKQRATQAIAQVKLAGCEHRAPQVLSGGQKRMAALAGLLAMQPSLLALDEPTSGLDPRGRRSLLEHLRTLPAALLVASHDLEFCLSLCERVVVMDGGKVVAEGLIRQVLADEQLMERHGLERPHSLDHWEGRHRHD